MRRVSSSAGRGMSAPATVLGSAPAVAPSSAYVVAASVRAFVAPPPAPPPPNKFALYGSEGRQDVFKGSTQFTPRGGQQPGRSQESELIGNTTDEDDLVGTMVQAKPFTTYTSNLAQAANQPARLPGVGGNSVPMDQLPKPPFHEYGRVLEEIRRAAFRQSIKKMDKNAVPERANPLMTPIVAVSMGKVLLDLSPEVRKLLKNPLFSGLEGTLRSCPMWFEVSQDSLQCRLTEGAHVWGIKVVPHESVPIPVHIEQSMLIDERQRADAVTIVQQRQAEEDRKIAEAKQKKDEQENARLHRSSATTATTTTPFKRRFPNPYIDDGVKVPQAAPTVAPLPTVPAAKPSPVNVEAAPVASDNNDFADMGFIPPPPSANPAPSEAPKPFTPRAKTQLKTQLVDEVAKTTKVAEPVEAPVERKPLLVSKNRHSAQGRARASETMAFDKLCRTCTLTQRDMAGPDFVSQGGTKKAILSKDSKLMGVVDLRYMPINTDEISTIHFLALHVGLGGPYSPDTSTRPPPPAPLIFPPTVHVPTLPELEYLDILYAKYGKISATQMAFALFEFIPTYFVEIRMLFRVMPHEAHQAIFTQERRDRHGKLISSFALFRKYTSLFEVSGLKAGERPTVRINWRLSPYLRRHPRFGMADPHMRMHSLEKEGTFNPTGVVSKVYETVTLPTDSSMAPTSNEKYRAEDRRGIHKEAKLRVNIFRILVKNLPRSEDKAKREEFLNLVQWINSFPQADLDTLNEVPQQEVIRIILKYPRIFQFSSVDGEDPNLFSSRHKQHAMEAIERIMGKSAASSHQSEATDESLAPVSLVELNGVDDEIGFDEMEEVILQARQNNGGNGPQAAPQAALDESKPPEDTSGMSVAPAQPEAAGSTPEAPVTAIVDTTHLGLSSSASIQNDAELSDADKGRVKQFNSSLEDGLIGLEDILLNDPPGGTELMDKGEGAEEYQEGEGADQEQESNADGEVDDVSRESKDDNATSAPPRQSAPHKARSSQQYTDDDTEEGFHFASDFDSLVVRRIPPEIAPRSLCDLDLSSTPEPKLLKFLMSRIPNKKITIERLSPQGGYSSIPAAPSLGATALIDSESSRRWRWVSLEALYKAMSTEEKRSLRPYRGLANFIRLHGLLYEVSEDSRYVIAHDATTVPPLIPTLRVFNIEERMSLPADFDKTSGPVDFSGTADTSKFKLVGQIPTNRMGIQLLDPNNPLLEIDVLCEEIANFLPDRPVPFFTFSSRLPPLLKAAIPNHGLRSLQRNKFLTVVQHHSSIYVMKSSLGEVENAETSDKVATLEESLAAMRALIPVSGFELLTIWLRLSFGPKNYIKQNYVNLTGFINAFPKLFYVETEPSRYGNGAMRQIVHLSSNAEAREAARKAGEVARDQQQPK